MSVPAAGANCSVPVVTLTVPVLLNWVELPPEIDVVPTPPFLVKVPALLKATVPQPVHKVMPELSVTVNVLPLWLLKVEPPSPIASVPPESVAVPALLMTAPWLVCAGPVMLSVAPL